MRRSFRSSAWVAALVVAMVALGCARWKRFQYEGFDRDEWQQPDAVVAALGLGPGDRVADLGAGGGYFTFRLAETVGESGRVYAVDVDEDLLAYLAERAEESGAANVEVVRAEPDDPRLPDGEIDLVFTCNTYHHLSDRPAYFRNLLGDLAPNGRVAIVEYDDRSAFAHATGHGTPADAIIEEMKEAGYRLVARHDFLDRQSYLVFGPDDGTGE